VSGQKLLAACRDVVSLGLGTFVVIHETLSGSVNLYLTVLAAFLLGVPGVAGLVNLAKGRVSVTLTPESPSESASLPSSPPSSS
jgi:hypothetical protein